MAAQMGFKINTLRLVPKDALYDGAAGLAVWLRTTWLPFVQRVPENLRDAFIAAVTRRYIAKHPLDAAGQCMCAWSVWKSRPNA